VVAIERGLCLLPPEEPGLSLTAEPPPAEPGVVAGLDESEEPGLEVEEFSLDIPGDLRGVAGVLPSSLRIVIVGTRSVRQR